MNVEAIREAAARIQPWLVEVRRDFHMHPELGRKETGTQEKIRAHLQDMEIAHRPIAGTGVLGIIEGKPGGKVVALRADIDALPIREKNDVVYKSRNDDVMHACGHDAHAAILLGAARVLNDMKPQLPGSVKLFFQPDEEGNGGAEPMIREGCMENPDVDYVLGLHVMSYLETGSMEIRYGKLNAASDSVAVTICGKSAHGAYPDKGIDAITAAAHVVTALQTLVSRNVSPLNSVVLSFGRIVGGEAGNALAEEVTLTGTLRTLDADTRQFCWNRIEEIAGKTAEAFGARAEVRIRSGYAALINHDDVVRIVEETGRELLGSGNVVHKEFPSLGAEDFSYFLEKAPGAFFHLGCGNKARGLVAPLHSSSFDLDENCLQLGVELQVVNALKLLG